MADKIEKSFVATLLLMGVLWLFCIIFYGASNYHDSVFFKDKFGKIESLKEANCSNPDKHYELIYTIVGSNNKTYNIGHKELNIYAKVKGYDLTKLKKGQVILLPARTSLGVLTYGYIWFVVWFVVAFIAFCLVVMMFCDN